MPHAHEDAITKPKIKLNQTKEEKAIESVG